MTPPRSPFPLRRAVAPALALLVLGAAGLLRAAPSPRPGRAPAAAPVDKVDPAIGRVTKSDAEWRRTLSAESYRVLRQKGTERAFTGRSWNEHRDGTYACAGCGLALFSAKTKYESGTGWPSFWAPLAANRVRERLDTSYGTPETEIVCARCDGHLGHVFDDGPGRPGCATA